ncbi:hypothetical protein NUH88_07690 [Nisaea acidiphila]|uniref:Lipoprotein n=1 Tax=Nisaea acidiphila TaxID=1862145 RepID=A0A9J7AXN7_9PROT|nr:hypothetical protein [Nisaea acidiphila]UUX51570.1 hypothetical protein NUH88_07690 [Nisaea acidiphila]
MMGARTLGIAFAAVLALTACSSEPPPSGKFPPNPERKAGAAQSLIDTDPSGKRCVVSGGTAAPLSLTTPRLVALSRFGTDPVVDCFADGYFRVRKAVPAIAEPLYSLRIAIPGAVDPAFGPDQKPDQGTRGKLFPQWVRIRLQENVFATEAERDRYYAAEAVRIQQAWGEVERILGRECRNQTKTEAKGLILLTPECRKARRILGERRDSDLAASEINRRQSTIR